MAKLRDMLQEPDAPLSQRELSTRLSKGGYPISQSHISRMFDTLEHLLPVIPQVLYAGLGKPTIARIINLRRRAESIWNQYLGTFNTSHCSGSKCCRHSTVISPI